MAKHKQPITPLSVAIGLTAKAIVALSTLYGRLIVLDGHRKR